MGPPVGPAILPRARWLAALVLPLAIAATVDSVDSASVVRRPPRLDMVAYARLHRRWVADHGPGCARDMAHLADYVPGHQIADPWGSELHLECARVANPYTSRYQLTVTVMSSGPDRILHDEDDLVGSDTTDAGPVPETEDSETLR